MRHVHICIELYNSSRRKERRQGVALNPHTPVAVLENILPNLDLVLIMSVNPGFGGQAFIESSFDKVRQLNALKSQQHSKAIIEIDGGVNTDNAAQLVEAGVQALVAGSAVFKSEDPVKTISLLKSPTIDTLIA